MVRPPSGSTCPHCAQPLLPISLPEAGGWDAPFHLVCFNDECPYYTGGWRWMEEQYGVKSSYRYRLDPATGTSSPIPVWSPGALRDCIIDADVTASTEAGEKPDDEGDDPPRRNQ